jgi:CRISPR-associated protein Csh1
LTAIVTRVSDLAKEFKNKTFMLDTLIKLGKQASQGLGEWDDILDRPKIQTETKKGDKIKNYVATLIFNLNSGILGLGELLEYDEEKSPERFFNVKIQGGNNKSIYTCTELKGLEQIRKTFFGKPDKNNEPSTQGQFTEAIDKDFEDFVATDLYETLKETFKQREGFEEFYLSDKGIADPKLITSQWSLNSNEQIGLVVVGVIWSDKGWHAPTYFRDIAGYKDFLRKKFIGDDLNENSPLTSPKICYATGEFRDTVKELEISSRYSLNKMFVTTTINYANAFDGGSFAKNYQVDKDIQNYLERGSKSLLERYKTRIAGIDHCIIPQLFSQEMVDIEGKLEKISGKSDLLFQYRPFEEMVNDIEDEVDETPYWITFLGFESDGNFFKTVNIIKDVSRTHFQNLILTFRRTNKLFKDIVGINWDTIMSAGEGNPLEFNLYTVYTLIPLRKDKEKKNVALALFKQILEKRPLEKEKLFGYFKELILCHKFERYKSYTNIYEGNPFDFAIRNAVFQYLALFQVLKQFNLIKNMEETNDQNQETEEPLVPLSDYQKKVEDFFIKMGYSDSQKALFYLGRILNTVAYEQYRKGYQSKPVLNKLNFNGMDRDDISRLRRDLTEKTQQFKLHKFTEPIFNKFTPLFDYNNWGLKPDEALFFILSGYSFNSK